MYFLKVILSSILFLSLSNAIAQVQSLNEQADSNNENVQNKNFNNSETVSLTAEEAKKKSDATVLIDPSLASSGAGFRARASLDTYTDFKETTDATKNTYAQMITTVFYDLEDGNNFSLFIPIQKDLSGEFEEKFFIDSRLAYAQNGLYKKGVFSLNMRYGFLYPTTEESKVRDEMLYGLELNPTMLFNLNDYVPGLFLVYIPRYRKRFHRFTTNRTGESIIDDSFLNIFVANYSFKDNWYVSSTLLYIMSDRYDGARVNDTFLTAFEFGHNFANSLNIRAGIMTGGNILNQQYGDNKTIQAFDRNATDFYTGVAYTF